MVSRIIHLSKRLRTLRAEQGRSALPPDLESCPGYQLRERRGRGSFGEVWEATAEDGTRVALKFMRCDDKAAPREIRTLQQIRQLTHPHLIRIEKVFCHASYLVQVMELASGSLQDLLEVHQLEETTPLRAARICHSLSQIAQVLDFLNARKHRLGGQLVAVRHCDVKPSNMLVFGGAVKLADFGLSVMTGSVSQRHPQCGSTSYAAPEVFAGNLSDRSDQYSLAVSYFQLRTGQLPFPNSPPQFRRDYARPVPDLSLLSPLEQPIVARALASITVDRWASCGEFMTALSHVVST